MKKLLNENFFVLTVLVNGLFMIVTLGLINISTEPAKTSSSQSPYFHQQKTGYGRYPSSPEENSLKKAEIQLKAEAVEAEILKAKIERLNKLKLSLENNIKNPSPIPPFNAHNFHDESYHQ